MILKDALGLTDTMVTREACLLDEARTASDDDRRATRSDWAICSSSAPPLVATCSEPVWFSRNALSGLSRTADQPYTKWSLRAGQRASKHSVN